MALHTLLGANGTIANELVPLLAGNGVRLRLVSRRPRPAGGAETVSADLLDRDAVARAVDGSEVVYLLAGIQYNARIWEQQWPLMMQNVIDACSRSGARLLFFDDVYMYGKVDGVMTEETPYNPCSRKGAVRARVARMLEDAIKGGRVTAAIARAVDFYGPGVTDKSAAGTLVFANMKKGRRAQWFINPDVPRSYTYTPDAAAALCLLAQSEVAWGQIWHLPSVQPALTGREFIRLAAHYMGASGKFTVLPKWLLKTAGWVSPFMREAYEMNYQDEFPFRFDATKFEKAFQFTPTSYEEGVRRTAAWFLENG